MIIKEGHYRIDLDVLLFPWKLTYKPLGHGHIPKGSFGKVHLAQDTKTRKRMACKLVSPGIQRMLFSGISTFFSFFFLAKEVVFTPLGGYNGHDFPSGNLCYFISEEKTNFVQLVQNTMLKTI